jgi:transposase
MGTIRKHHSAELKAKVVLEAFKEQKTLGELSSIYQVSSMQIVQWKKQAKDRLAAVFTSEKSKGDQAQEELIERLYRQVGKLQMEYDWLKKKVGNI